LSARGTVPELIADYDHEYVRHYHLSTWWRVNWSAQLTNPPASMQPGGPVPVPEGPLRNSILIILTHIGGDDPRVAPLLLAAVHDHNMQLRDSYISWLKGNTNLASAVTLGERDVIVALGDSEAKARAAAADMLGQIARNHPEVIAPLLKAAQDPDRAVRDNAMESLTKSTVKLESTLPILNQVWQDHPEGVGRFGTIMLIKSAGGGAKFLPALNDELSNADPALREAAARALGRFGPRAQFAAPRLRELTNAAAEPVDDVRHAAVEALRMIRP
jgi:HEAT repeat protein